MNLKIAVGSGNALLIRTVVSEGKTAKVFYDTTEETREKSSYFRIFIQRAATKVEHTCETFAPGMFVGQTAAGHYANYHFV